MGARLLVEAGNYKVFLYYEIIMKLDHIVILLSNLEQSLPWYTTLLGLMGFNKERDHVFGNFEASRAGIVWHWPQIMVDFKNRLCSNRWMRNTNDSLSGTAHHIDGFGAARMLPLKADLLALDSLLPLLISGAGAGAG